jgi:hypothetical protein
MNFWKKKQNNPNIFGNHSKISYQIASLIIDRAIVVIIANLLKRHLFQLN